MVITSACHAEGPGSIPGNSVKMWTALPHFGVAGSIPASSFWTVAQPVEHVASVRKNTHLVLAEDTHSKKRVANW